MRRLAVTLVLAVAVGGCGGDAGPGPGAVPADLEIHYRWNSGVSNVGPDYAAYSVSLDAAGSGTIRFTVGHPSAEQDEWTETFGVAADDLRALYAGLRDAGLFSGAWARRDPVPGSGAGSSLAVVADGSAYAVPTDLADPDDARSIAAVYESIRALVPEGIWERYEARRGEYLAGHDA
ncbi:MAG: hypothetical protein KQH83_09270 [Actinobacteria bacterium]|nr:hypothetical protein [Actinomycetota bacterium]